MKKLLLSCALLLSSAASTLMAVPAMPGLVKTVTQPDGTTLKVRVIGDEHSHCYLTEDLVPLMTGADGIFRYATLDAAGRPVASDIKAADPALRSRADREFVALLNPELTTGKLLAARASSRKARRNAAPLAAESTNSSAGVGLIDAKFPHEGDVHALVILVEYSDVKFTVKNAGDFFTRMLNEEGFSDYNAVGSARDYFIASSSGQFRPTFDVYGPVTLPGNRASYGANDALGQDVNAEGMVVDACNILHREGKINFADYDTDNDGKVDNIYVIYAGQGEASYGPKESVWPHQFDLSSANIDLEIDGKIIDHYGCCNEYDEVRPSGIGTFCHEFGHVLGLPDLYTTSYGNAASLTPGSYDIMDFGSYNNDSRTPPSYSVFERNAMNWIDLIELTGPNSIVLDDIQESNSGCIITTSSRNEFFLFENRQQTGWDTYLPGHGMLVWHIDYNASVWKNNAVNNSFTHQYVDIEEAGNRANNGNAAYMASYPFPGTSRVTSFTDDTKPSMVTWRGESLNLPITNITEDKGRIMFDVAGGLFDLPAPAVTAKDVNAGGFTLEWEAVEKALAYTVNVYTKDADGQPVAVPAFTGYETDGTSVTVDRLDAETRYYATVVAHTSSIFSDPSDEVEITTADFDFALAVPRIPVAPMMGTTSFTATWQPVKDATDYELTVKGIYEVPTTDDTADFGKRTTLSLPEGWSANTTAYYSTNGYYKTASPALQMNQDGTYLMTPVYDKDVIGVAFWCRLGGALGTDNYLEIEGRTDADASWQLFGTVKNIPMSNDGLDYKLSDFPAGIRQIRITYFKPNNGNMALDDCVISTGGTDERVFDKYDSYSVGNTTEHVVSYDEATRPLSFVYTVKALNSATQAASLESDRVAVLDPAGADDIVADGIIAADGAAEIYTLQGVRVHGTPAPGIYISRAGSKVQKIIVK